MADPTPAPAPDAAPPAAPTLDWDAGDTKAWKGRIERARQRQKAWHPWWDDALKSYAPQVTESPATYGAAIRTNRIFTLVERKASELFYQQPDVQVSPAPLLDVAPEGTQIAATHAAILNAKLGREGVDVKNAVARPAIFDYLLFGAGWTKLGYRSYTQDTPTTDPATGAVTVAPVPVHSECFWEALSPKQVLVPADWNSTVFDKAPWLAHSFEIPLAEAKRLWTLPENFSASTDTADPDHFDHGDAPDAAGSVDMVRGVEIWYRSSVFRDDIVHPDHLTQLILLDGLATPVVHQDSPYQAFDALGRLTPDSMVGFPLHPLVVRLVTDAAYVMSDVAVALPLTHELDKFREQMILQRDANLLKWVYNTDVVGKDTIDKVTAAPQGGMIGLPAEAFAQPGGPIQPLPHGPYPRENFEYNNYIDSDLQRTHALDSGSAGTTAESGLTATEANIRQANVNVRLGYEQGVVADWYLRGVTKFASLLQKFLGAEEAAAIVGPDRAHLWDSWRREIPSRLAFTMAPDASLRSDTPLERKQLQELYTYLANDPALNRQYLGKKLLLKYHLDPSLALLPPDQVPQPKPAPPSLSLSFKGEDLNPLMPQAPIVLDLLTKAGVQIDPAAIQNAMQLGMMAMAVQREKAEQEREADGQPAHGGKVAQMESLDKHNADETGGMQGSGAMNPLMGGMAGLS